MQFLTTFSQENGIVRNWMLTDEQPTTEEMESMAAEINYAPSKGDLFHIYPLTEVTTHALNALDLLTMVQPARRELGSAIFSAVCGLLTIGQTKTDQVLRELK